jgi:hypothetical protein
MTDESLPKPPRTVPHDRVVAAMELVYGPLPDLRPDISISEAGDDERDLDGLAGIPGTAALSLSQTNRGTDRRDDHGRR